MTLDKHIYLGMCGCEKSGNYVLYRILKSILDEGGGSTSYANRYKIWSGLDKTNIIDYSFPEIVDLDEVAFCENYLWILNSHFSARAVIFDVSSFDQLAPLVWAHQPPSNLFFEYLSPERLWFYLIRDGRAVINSWMHYATSERMLKRKPQYKISDVRILYDNISYFTSIVEKYVNHIEAYLRMKDRFNLVKYEELIDSPNGAINKICQKLGRTPVAGAFEAVDFNSSFRQAPLHVRKADKRDWEKYFKNEHVRIYRHKTEPALNRLGFSDYVQW